MAESEKHEEYFWERYQTLVRTEEESSLYNILSGVGHIETFSDVRTVLKMYDAEAEKVKPNYWGNRLIESLKLQKNMGLTDAHNVSIYSGGNLSLSTKYRRVVLNMEQDLGGNHKDITEELLNGAQI